MIKFSVFYPTTKGKKFDMVYYCEKHMPMVQQKLGAACKKWEVDAGVAGFPPGSDPTYVAICHIHCDSTEAFLNAFGPHAAEINRDVSNFTDIKPVAQISEIKK